MIPFPVSSMSVQKTMLSWNYGLRVLRLSCMKRCKAHGSELGRQQALHHGYTPRHSQSLTACGTQAYFFFISFRDGSSVL